ncbi:MAG TPA: YdcF family protein [Mariprofundaceae bacterium]|nr:YdcF family protein [Mariprofundaceae bacterium]
MSGLLWTKSVALLLLPPGVLVVLGAVGLLFWRRLWGRLLVGMALALLWLLSTEPVSGALLHPLESEYPAYETTRLPDSLAAKTAIVLLGGGVYRHAPEYGGRDSLGQEALMRTVYAARLAQGTGVSVYATGGVPLETGAEPEGAVMARWLVHLGLPKTGVHAEITADNTWENAADLRPLLARDGIRHVILVTSAFHMPRAIFCFSRQRIDAVAAPCAYHGRQAGEYNLTSYLPQWTAFRDSVLALHEYLGLLWYRIHYAGSHFGLS